MATEHPWDPSASWAESRLSAPRSSTSKGDGMRAPNLAEAPPQKQERRPGSTRAPNLENSNGNQQNHSVTAYPTRSRHSHDPAAAVHRGEVLSQNPIGRPA